MAATGITIVADKCRRDGLCAQVCPVRIFDWRLGEVPQVRRVEQCVLCGQCLAVCPSDGIVHSRLEESRFTRIERRTPVEGAALMELLRQRRSVRVYQPQPVPRELLARIVEMAGFAPTSAHGGEGWTRFVTVVSGEAEMRRVLELTVDYLRELRAVLDSLLVRGLAKFLVPPRRGRSMLPDLDMRLAEYSHGRDAIVYGAPAAMFVHTPRETPDPQTDCDAALFAMMLAAHAHGLGTCWNGWLAKAAETFRVRHATGLRRLLQIPDHHEVGAAMTVGFPGLRLHSVPPRETTVRWAGTEGAGA
jgi:nitroreductase/NAD-dependent dihydropyrimidine dehydrogenase PreA subunit